MDDSYFAYPNLYRKITGKEPCFDLSLVESVKYFIDSVEVSKFVYESELDRLLVVDNE